MLNNQSSAIPAARRLLYTAIASTFISAPSFVYAAEDAAPVALEQVLVNARRDVENVQDVPVSMQVLTGEAIQNMQMTNVKDLAKIAPGLTMTTDSTGGSPVIIMRGVRWNNGSGAAAIPIYMNEVVFDPGQILSTMYDVDRVEVLRGPQGTSRGAPSIPGAVLITTRQADLDQMGGYLSGQLGNQERRDIQGAIGIPVIPGKLGVRIAGFNDHNSSGDIKSVNSSRHPSFDLESARLSLRFEPIDTVTADLMFQRTDEKASAFTQVVGTGSAGRPGIPAHYNGPAIALDDYRGVQEEANKLKKTAELITLNLNWEVLGHTLSYNFGSQTAGNPDYSTTSTDFNNGSSQDFGNQIIGYDPMQFTGNKLRGSSYYTNELRLSSLRDADNLIDYDVGVYSQKSGGHITNGTPVLLSGALGNPLNPSVNASPAALDRYSTFQSTDIRLAVRNWSVYGNLNIHLPNDTELSLGLRDIHDRRPANIFTNLTRNAYNAVPDAFLPAPCAFLAGFGAVPSPLYANTCDFPVAAGLANLPTNTETKETATLYNASLSHKFSPDFMGYMTTGTSWRAGLPAIANPGLPSNLTAPAPEEATSYEIGFKSMWLQTLRVNFDIYQIDYKGQLTQLQFVDYYDTVSNKPALTNQAFFGNADSQIRGAELEIAARPFSELTMSANLSYSAIKASGGRVPCAGSVSATNPINTCQVQSGTNLNASPRLQAILNSEYVVPLGAVDGYLSGVVNYSGRNGNFGTSIDPTPAYALVDLFLGVRDGEGSWDVGFYTKNAFNRTVQLTRNNISDPSSSLPASGYYQVTATPQREIGLSARYAFGSK